MSDDENKGGGAGCLKQKKHIYKPYVPKDVSPKKREDKKCWNVRWQGISANDPA
jgi:hypothetical protein